MDTFRDIRINGGYDTQSALAQKVGVKNASVARWEKGQRIPRPEMLIKLSDLLGVTEREIIVAMRAGKEEPA